MLRSIHRMLSPEFPKEADGLKRKGVKWNGLLYHIMSFTLTALSPSVGIIVSK